MARLSFFGRIFAASTAAFTVGLITHTPWLFWTGAYFVIVTVLITIIGANQMDQSDPEPH